MSTSSAPPQWNQQANTYWSQEHQAWYQWSNEHNLYYCHFHHANGSEDVEWLNPRDLSVWTQSGSSTSNASTFASASTPRYFPQQPNPPYGAQGSPTGHQHVHSYQQPAGWGQNGQRHYQYGSSHSQAHTTHHYPQTHASGHPVPGPPTVPNTLGPEIRPEHTTEPPQSTLHPSFEVRHQSFFKEGRVFKVLFTEPLGSTAPRMPYNDAISYVKFGEQVYTQARRFIVVKARKEFCYACPIFTYGGQGTLKPGITASEHAIVYTIGPGREPKLLLGETGIVKRSIRIEAAPNSEILSDASRIRFSIHHPIQMNIKVQDLGMVQKEDIPYLRGYYEEESRR